MRIILVPHCPVVSGDAWSLHLPTKPERLDGIRAAACLDFGLNQEATPDITVSLAGTNVTGNKARNFESRENFIREMGNDDTTCSPGIRFNY